VAVSDVIRTNMPAGLVRGAACRGCASRPGGRLKGCGALTHDPTVPSSLAGLPTAVSRTCPLLWSQYGVYQSRASFALSSTAPGVARE
jgi:hypothetical protein